MFLGSCFHWRVEAEWRRVSIHSIQTENNRHAPANQRTIAHLGWPHCSRGSQFVVCGSQQCTDHLSDYIYLPLLPLFLFQTSSSLQPSSSSGPLHQVSSSLPHGESFPTTKIFFILPPSSFRLPPSAFLLPSSLIMVSFASLSFLQQWIPWSVQITPALP